MPSHVFEAGPEHDGLRLDKFLAGEIPNHSRAQVQRLIDDGRVRLARVATAQGQHAGPQPAMPSRSRSPRPRRSTLVARGPAARHPLRRRRRGRRQQARRAGRPPRRRPRDGHAGARPAAPRQGPERHRRRAAAGHRAPARQGHVRRDGRGQARPGAPGAGPPVPRPRGREGVRRAGLGRGPQPPAHRPAARPRSGAPGEDLDARPPRAPRRDPRDLGPAPARASR